jgi:hypothetical protein
MQCISHALDCRSLPSADTVDAPGHVQLSKWNIATMAPMFICRCDVTTSRSRTSRTLPASWMRQPSQQARTCSPCVVIPQGWTTQRWTTQSCFMGSAGGQQCSHVRRLLPRVSRSQVSFARRRAEKRAPARAAAAGGDRRRRPGGAVDGEVRGGRRAHTRGAGGARPPWRQGRRLEGASKSKLGKSDRLWCHCCLKGGDCGDSPKFGGYNRLQCCC